MRDQRLAPFCYQTLAATAAIRERFDGKERTTALALYQAMTELANEARAREFEVSRAELAEAAGVSVPTVDRYGKAFVEIGLLVIEKRSDGRGGNLPNVWFLVEGEGGGKASLPPGKANRGVNKGIKAKGASKVDSEKELGSGGEFEGGVGYPEAVKRSLPNVMTLLGRIARAHHAATPNAESVARAMCDFPDRDFESVANDFAFWALHGNGVRRKIKSVAGTWRNFLRKADAKRPRGQGWDNLKIIS